MMVWSQRATRSMMPGASSGRAGRKPMGGSVTIAGVILASISGEDITFLVMSVFGLVLGATVYLSPGLFDRATRTRLRWQGLPEDEAVIEKDRQRRRFIALILCVGSAAILASTLGHL